MTQNENATDVHHKSGKKIVEMRKRRKECEDIRKKIQNM